MIIFDPFTLLGWIILISFLPGVIIAISLLKKTEFWFIEKILIGSALGIVLHSAIPFILFLAGINYSYQTAIISTAIFYIAAIAVFIWTKTYEGIWLDGIKKAVAMDEIKKNAVQHIVTVVLLLIIIIAFLVRLQTYSPIHYELDPYYYIYSPQQILTQGGTPLEDNTAWWPELKSGHRAAPLLAYMEALWYSFYTQGGEYNNYLFAVITSIYPPLAAAFAIFFLYLFVAANYRREYALGAAAIASFLPVFIFKLSAGVMEVQPYAFFALSFFLSMYAWGLKEKSNAIMALAGIAYAALALGSGSEILGVATLIAFLPLYSIFLFITSKESKEIKEFVILNGVVIAIGPILGSLLLEGAYTNDYGISKTAMLIGLLAFSAVIYLIKNKEEKKGIDKEVATYLIAGILIVSLIAIVFTPLGGYVKGIANAGLGVAKYNEPLHRTIAEQPPAGPTFDGSFGFIAFVPKEGEISSILLAPLSLIANAIMWLVYSALNAVLGVGLSYDFKADSLLLPIILLSFVAFGYSLYRSIKSKPTMFLLYVAILMPTMLVGLLKLKYVIYLGFFLAPTIGVIFGELEIALNGIARRLTTSDPKKKSGSHTMHSEMHSDKIYYSLIAILAALVIMQFLYGGIMSVLLSTSSNIRFENNPEMFKEKFTSFCGQLSGLGIKETGTNGICDLYAKHGIYFCSVSDEDICKVAEDPVAYANKGINEQYNKKLCYYSLMSDLLNPKPEEISSAQLRCTPISDYWIETMEWIKNSTEQDARITSWWDYGHWTNFFGQRDTVLRNEHRSLKMIGEVAKGYLDDTPEELAAWMKEHGSKYALFDVEINGIDGGKYHALNYLSCAYMNETNVSKGQLESVCEHEHLWETVYVPKNPQGQECTISVMENKTGVMVYAAKFEKEGGKIKESAEPRYCLGQTTLITGSKIPALYYLNKTYPNGDLSLNKAFLRGAGEGSDVFAFITLYTNDTVWIENGEIKGGWEDRKGRYYDSNVYKAFFLEDLPGFKLVFKSKGGEVKIYKIDE